MWPRSFRDAFCQVTGCGAEDFEIRVFWRCLHRRSLAISALIYLMRPTYFSFDFQTIRQLGVATSFEEFGAEIDSFRSDNRRHGGLLRRTLRVRVSGRRLMDLIALLPADMPVGRRERLSWAAFQRASGGRSDRQKIHAEWPDLPVPPPTIAAKNRPWVPRGNQLNVPPSVCTRDPLQSGDYTWLADRSWIGGKPHIVTKPHQRRVDAKRYSVPAD